MALTARPALSLRSMSTVPLAVTASAALALLATQAHRLQRARSWCAGAAGPFSRAHRSPARRVLLIGDSTGVGVGCDQPSGSIAARLAREFTHADVRNLCGNGATVGDALRTLRREPPGERYDLVLVFAGGNDVLRCTTDAVLRRQLRALLDELMRTGDSVLWAGMANVGLAPLFLPPFSWWMTARTRRVNALLAQEVQAAGGRFIGFFRERGEDPFSDDVGRYYAADGVHPSAAAYAWCYARMQPAIREALGAG